MRVHVFCEGQTEETFVRDVLLHHFNNRNIFLNPIVVRTSKTGRGGVSTYGKIKSQIEKKCKEDSSAWVTTLLDYYQFPLPPGYVKSKNTSSIKQAMNVQAAFQNDIAEDNFIAHLVVHEFEGLLFSAPSAFATWFDDKKIIAALEQVRIKFDSPEHINDGIETAPSKRIQDICGNYDKVLHGSSISQDIGLDTIRNKCPLFDGWLKSLEALVKKT